jgi:hypothetical protein
MKYFDYDETFCFIAQHYMMHVRVIDYRSMTALPEERG